MVRDFAPLCVAVPLMAAAVLAPLNKRVSRAVSCTVATVTTLAVVGMSAALAWYTSENGMVVSWMGGWKPRGGLAIGIDLAVDPLNAALTAFIALLVLGAIVYTYQKFDIVGTLFHALLLAFLGAMCGYALTGDLFDMFVWFELMTAAAIALTAHKIEESSSLEGAVNLAITNSLGGFVVLLGIGFVFARTDALNFAQLGIVLAQHPVDALVVVGFGLIVAGYFVKGAVAPFHFWLDDAHAVAPTPVCILFSGIMVQLALYGVARTYWTVFAPALGPYEHRIGALFVGVGVVTAIGGAIMAFGQRHLKRLLAFSTVSHSGMFVAAIGLFGAAGAAACALFVVAHGTIKSALFACAGNYLNRFRSLDTEVLGGKGRLVPFNSALFLIGGLALAGLPPFAISAAKALYDEAMKNQGLTMVVVLMALASAIDAGAVLMAGLHITFGIGKSQQAGYSPREEETECPGDRLDRIPWPMLGVPLVLMIVAAVVGSSTAVQQAAHDAARAFVDSKSYAQAVIAGAHVRLAAGGDVPGAMHDAGINVGIAAAAVLAALLGLFRDHIPERVRPVLGPPLRALRHLHSGIFTDYTAYMMFGIAAYTIYLLAVVR